jgi:hypothetical protein
MAVRDELARRDQQVVAEPQRREAEPFRGPHERAEHRRVVELRGGGKGEADVHRASLKRV